MKKQFHALSLCLTLALCVSGSTAALAEAPAATPAPQDQRVITDVSPLEDQIRNIVGFTTSTGGFRLMLNRRQAVVPDSSRSFSRR